MVASDRTIAGALALLCIVVSDVWGNGPASCDVQLTRQEAINLLAEGAARANANAPVKFSVDPSAVEEAKRRISALLEKGWELEVKRPADCSFAITYKDPKRFGSFWVFADQKKQLVDWMQHR